MNRLMLVASHARIIPTKMLWQELMADTDSNAGATRVCAELRARNEL
jgi:hypothetical protein